MPEKITIRHEVVLDRELPVLTPEQQALINQKISEHWERHLNEVLLLGLPVTPPPADLIAATPSYRRGTPQIRVLASDMKIT